MIDNIVQKFKDNNLEYRENQLYMMHLIYKTFQNNKNVLIEAQTGIGKTLAYLLSALKFKNDNNLDKIIISTKTKILQDQLLNKDIPLAKKIYGDFSALVLYGSQEYVCLDKIHYFKSLNIAEADEILKIIKTKNICLIENLKDFIIFDDISPFEIGRDPDDCKGKKCPFYDDCLYYKELEKVNNVDVLVVNHYLLLANIETDFSLFDAGDILILDEAHSLEDICIEFWGYHLSYFAVRKLLLEIHNPFKKNRYLRYKIKNFTKKERHTSPLKELSNMILIPDHHFETVQEGINIIEFQIEEMLAKLPLIFKESLDIKSTGYNKSFSLKKEQIILLIEKLKLLFRDLIDMIVALSLISHEENDEELKKFEKRIVSLYSKLNFFEHYDEQEDENFILWGETDENDVNIKNIFIHLSPITINKEFKEKILENFRYIAFISATLSANGDFSYIKNTLGIDNADAYSLESDFNLKEQQYIYIPIMNNVPNTDEFLQESAELIKKLISLFNGRTLILTTSNYAMHYLAEYLKEHCDVIKQGEMNRNDLLEYKRNKKESVLIGSFGLWEGIDIQGDALQSVIIVKLPFDVPSDPLIAARSKYLKKLGYNPFLTFFLPRAILKFKQGIGRLIRSKTDKGLLTILDPRIYTQYYGKFFYQMLEGKSVVNPVELIKEESLLNKEISYDN